MGAPPTTGTEHGWGGAGVGPEEELAAAPETVSPGVMLPALLLPTGHPLYLGQC